MKKNTGAQLALYPSPVIVVGAMVDGKPNWTLVRYLNLQDMGMVLGTSCGTPSQTRRSRYPQAAYELGKKLR